MKQFIIFSFLFLFYIFAAFGNISAPPQPKEGNISGQNSFSDISVINEDLTINLSEVVDGRTAKINALYRIHVSKNLRNLNLVFVANNLTESKYMVKIDDVFVNGDLREYDSIPQGWYPPDSIDFLGNKIPFKYTHKGLIAFTIDSLSIGEHTLEVSYEADVAEWYNKEDLAITKTFVYILKPYQGWKEFKNLNLNLFIPNDWECTSNIQLDQSYPHALHGFWEELPAHHLAIAISPKQNYAESISIMFVIVSGVISLLLLVMWMYVVTNYRIKNRKHRIIQILNVIFVAFIATVILYIIYYKEADIKNHLLDGQLNPYYTYGDAYFIIVSPIIWLMAIIIAFVIDFILTKKVNSKYKKHHR